MEARFIKIAGVYFAIACILGLVMGIIHNFTFTSVRSHLNLLGWVSIEIFGLIYSFDPHTGKTKLANTHFWLHNLGLPIMQGALFYQLLTGNESLVVAMIIGSIMLVVGVILFMINLFSQIRTSHQVESNKNVTI